jgi:hypothetical protein
MEFEKVCFGAAPAGTAKAQRPPSRHLATKPRGSIAAGAVTPPRTAGPFL